MKNITDEQVARIFAMYYGADYAFGYADGAKFHGVSNMNFNQCKAGPLELSANCKLLLTPLEDIEYEDALAVCAAACPELYGDYRFNKWEVIDRNDNGGTYIKIARHKSAEYFTINKSTAEVYIWDTDFNDIDQMYSQVYFQRAIAVPLHIAYMHPLNGKTAIELGVAVDKNKTLQR